MSIISNEASTSLTLRQSVNKDEREKIKKKTDLFLGKTIQDMIDLINDNGSINECEIKLKKCGSKKIVKFKINAGNQKLQQNKKYFSDSQSKSTHYVTSDGKSLLSSKSQSILPLKNKNDPRNRLTNTSISDCRCGCVNGKNLTSFTSTNSSDFNSDIFSATTESSGESSLYSSSTDSFGIKSGKLHK
uniref:Uncharacterized protein n=1 Tax=Strongyloides venezuelensis TaxID=75913 RepID=A0A0K0FXK1_STRVS